MRQEYDRLCAVREDCGLQTGFDGADKCNEGGTDRNKFESVLECPSHTNGDPTQNVRHRCSRCSSKRKMAMIDNRKRRALKYELSTAMFENDFHVFKTLFSYQPVSSLPVFLCQEDSTIENDTHFCLHGVRKQNNSRAIWNVITQQYERCVPCHRKHRNIEDFKGMN